MPVSLSRIEREYVVLNLEDQMPPLSLLAGATIYTIPGDAYSLKGETVSITGLFPCLALHDSVRVFFRHKQRAMFFDSRFTSANAETWCAQLPSSIFMEDSIHAGGKTNNIKIFLKDRIFESTVSAIYPLADILVDPELCLLRAESMQKVASRAGIDAEGSLVRYRLFEYLDGFRVDVKCERTYPETGDFIFADHQYVLVSVKKMEKAKTEKGIALPILISYEHRQISVDSAISGSIRVNADLTLLCLDIRKAQEEDKRFMYEKLYKENYQILK